jgi:2-(1,2-epoxy-1,2-dihydrophenyl)acetyl-CoA isomerase
VSVTDGIQLEQTGSVAIVTMNNPERRNAFFPEMRRKLTATLNELGSDTAVRAIVLTGAGSHFCAGADVSRMRREGASPGALQARENIKEVGQLLRAIAAGSKPVIAAVEGDAVGAGFSMACASDFVVAARNCRFGAAFARLGILPDMGMLYTLPRRVGLAKARQLMMLATMVNGVEATELGIVDQLTGAGEALMHARKLAEQFQDVAPAPVALIKAALADGVNSIEEVLRIERDLQPLLSSTEDAKEGISAFKEKRKPSFMGR